VVPESVGMLIDSLKEDAKYPFPSFYGVLSKGNILKENFV